MNQSINQSINHSTNQTSKQSSKQENKQPNNNTHKHTRSNQDTRKQLGTYIRSRGTDKQTIICKECTYSPAKAANLKPRILQKLELPTMTRTFYMPRAGVEEPRTRFALPRNLAWDRRGKWFITRSSQQGGKQRNNGFSRIQGLSLALS